MNTTAAMTRLRQAAQTLGAKDAIISNAMLYQALGATEQPERDRIRKRCTTLVKTGELVRAGRGQYRYNKAAAPARSGELITRMWRTLKSSSTPFTCQDLSRISGACLSHALKYIQFLQSDGFIRLHGKRRHSKLYRTTQRVRETQSAPMPPRPMTDPFEDQRRHVHELVGLFLLRDPYQPAVRQQITAACRAILDRFDDQRKGGQS